MDLFSWYLFGWGVVAFVSLILLLNISAPYGRFNRSGWGPQIDNRIAWIIMELVSPLTLIGTYLAYERKASSLVIVFIMLWGIHYVNRSLIFPFRTKTDGKKMPLLIAIFACCFNSVNGFTNGYWFAVYADYSVEWFWDIRFLIGFVLFVFGFFVNVQSDNILFKLRNPGEKEYKIPFGGFYKWVSSPNYMAEIIEWLGFAIMTWSPAAFVFSLWTVANLLPRAISSHRWYKSKFNNYPTDRKALIPKIL
jgi:protein-S-isoprenylcysteine O-methyltransferase Ste14